MTSIDVFHEYEAFAALGARTVEMQSEGQRLSHTATNANYFILTYMRSLLRLLERQVPSWMRFQLTTLSLTTDFAAHTIKSSTAPTGSHRLSPGPVAGMPYTASPDRQCKIQIHVVIPTMSSLHMAFSLLAECGRRHRVPMVMMRCAEAVSIATSGESLAAIRLLRTMFTPQGS